MLGGTIGTDLHDAAESRVRAARLLVALRAGGADWTAALLARRPWSERPMRTSPGCVSGAWLYELAGLLSGSNGEGAGDQGQLATQTVTGVRFV